MVHPESVEKSRPCLESRSVLLMSRGMEDVVAGVIDLALQWHFTSSGPTTRIWSPHSSPPPERIRIFCSVRVQRERPISWKVVDEAKTNNSLC
jgi:hypothetical protein